MKITKLQFENFKSFEEFDFDGFAKVNVLYGFNNSGKSNLLKLISLIFERKEIPGQTPEEIQVESLGNFWEGIIDRRPFLFRNDDWNNKEKPISCTVTFEEKVSNIETDSYTEEIIQYYSADDKFKIEFTINIVGRSPYQSDVQLEACRINDTVVCSRDEGRLHYFTESQSETLQENGFEAFTEFFRNFNDSVLLIDSNRFFNPERYLLEKEPSELAPQKFKSFLKHLSTNPNFFETFDSLIKKVLSYDTVSKKSSESYIEFVNNEESVPFLKSERVVFLKDKYGELDLRLFNGKLWLPIEGYGSGIQQLIYILTQLYFKKPQILLLEEAELNLSPMYQNRLIEFLDSQDNELEFLQIFLTTHSPFLTYHQNWNSLFFRNQKGKTIVKKADSSKLSNTYGPAKGNFKQFVH